MLCHCKSMGDQSQEKGDARPLIAIIVLTNAGTVIILRGEL